MPKVIGVDNFDNEMVSDILVLDDIATMAEAEQIARVMNEAEGGDFAPRYFRAVPDDHKLYKFEP